MKMYLGIWVRKLVIFVCLLRSLIRTIFSLPHKESYFGGRGGRDFSRSPGSNEGIKNLPSTSPLRLSKP